MVAGEIQVVIIVVVDGHLQHQVTMIHKPLLKRVHVARISILIIPSVSVVVIERLERSVKMNQERQQELRQIGYQLHQDVIAGFRMVQTPTQVGRQQQALKPQALRKRERRETRRRELVIQENIVIEQVLIEILVLIRKQELLIHQNQEV